MRPMTISEMEVAEIEANLFTVARPIVRDQPEFPWPRDRAGKVTASRLASSQALAVRLLRDPTHCPRVTPSSRF